MKHIPGPISLLCILTTIAVCMGCTVTPTLAERRTAASSAIDLLQRSHFEDAASSAKTVLTEDAGNPYAALVQAISQYKSTMHQFFLDGKTVAAGIALTRTINKEYLRTMLERTEADLTEVRRLLQIAASEPNISMELCVACMDVDWNQDSVVDRRDTQLFEIELDGADQSIDVNDPRRKPTFRLDHGDVIWAQAFVSFHLAALNLIAAYDYTDINLAMIMSGNPVISIRLLHPEKVLTAQQLIQDGLAYSLASREAYLAETDDDREWLPNPSQRNHPIPLEVTSEFYETWRLVVTDLQKIVSGEESLSVTEIAQLGDHQWENPPRGYINVGKLFANAKDITIDVERMEDALDDIEDEDRSAAEVERLLEYVLGFCYVKSAKATPLLHRMDRMKAEVERGQEGIERKLKYLFWVN